MFLTQGAANGPNQMKQGPEREREVNYKDGEKEQMSDLDQRHGVR